MRPSTYCFIVVGLVLGVIWGIERHTAEQLHTELDEGQQSNAAVARLQQENAKLRRRLVAGSDTKADRTGLGQVERVAELEPPNESTEGALRPGTWAPASAWKNRGRESPEAAIETILWAASGGDTDFLKKALVLPNDTETKVDGLLSKVPQLGAGAGDSAKDFVALVVAGGLPMDSAEIVAKQPNQDDTIIEYVRFKDSDGRTRQAFLSMENTSDGWKLTVPASAVGAVPRPAVN